MVNQRAFSEAYPVELLPGATLHTISHLAYKDIFLNHPPRENLPCKPGEKIEAVMQNYYLVRLACVYVKTTNNGNLPPWRQDQEIPSWLHRALSEADFDLTPTKDTPPMLFPIVGAHYRPPARAILEHLSPDTPLLLQAEPENPYDPGAIKVLLPPEHLPQGEDFAELCSMNYGIEMDDLRASPIHLGYIPKKETHIVHPFLAEGRATGTFTITAAGKPAITVKDTP